MKNLLSLFAAVVFFSSAHGHAKDSIVAKRFFDEALTNGMSYQWLESLCNSVGARLSGSPQAEKAVEWSKELMKNLDFDSVYLQEVMVPHWVRGEKEEAKIISSTISIVPVLALGGSIGTGAKGITAEVVEIKNFDELQKTGESGIKGKIVFYNHPMDPKFINTGSAYGEAVEYRWKGASEAARYGAVGAIVRSMGLAKDDFPHTGAMGYNDSLPKIPSAAISNNGADLLSNMLKNDSKLKFYLKMNCKTLPDAKSYNVIGELRGSEYPREIIVVGGHLDSWDVGQGAHDDGAGCVQAIEALRLFSKLGIKPKRTIRAVMYMNEENGTRGAEKYAELSKINGDEHIAAIESDGGGFMPTGFGINATQEIISKIESWKPVFECFDINKIGKGWGGTDVGKLEGQCKAIIGLRVSGQRYFDYHHTDSDTFDKVNKRELELGAAAMAVLVYLVDEYGL